MSINVETSTFVNIMSQVTWTLERKGPPSPRQRDYQRGLPKGDCQRVMHFQRDTALPKGYPTIHAYAIEGICRPRSKSRCRAISLYIIFVVLSAI